MPYIQSLAEFSESMDCKSIQLQSGAYLFENGAVSNGREHQPPPEDKFLRARRKKQYYGVKLKTAEDAFRKVKGEVNAKSHCDPMSSPPPDEYDVESLRRLQAEVFEFRKKVEEQDKILAESPEGKAQQQRKELEDFRRKEQAKFAAICAEIEI